MEEFNDEAVQRFEEMIKNNEVVFFDSTEFEDIIDYYLEIGDYQFAELAIRKARQVYPEVVSLKIKQLELFVDKNENNLAKGLIDKLAEIAGNDIDYLICCANYYSNLGNPKRAIKYCKRALELDDEQVFLHNFIGDEYQNLNDPFLALKHYQAALNYDPTDEYSLQNIMLCYGQINRSDKALQFINHYLDKYPYSETAWLEYGIFQFNERNFAEAITGFDYLLAIDNGSISGYSYKAACFEALKQWKKAIEVYRESQDFEYTKSYSFFKIGQCFLKLRQPAAALTSLQKALYEDPQFYPAMIAISKVYEKLGNVGEAIHFAKEASRFNEDDMDLQKRLAFLYVTSGDLNSALVCLKRMVDQQPRRFYNWYAYAEVLMLKNDFEQAITVLTGALKKHHRAELYYQLSNCFFHVKNEENGRKALEQAITLDPKMLKDMQMKYPFLDDEVKKTKYKTN